MDRPGVRQVPEGSGEQGKMEKTGRKIICGAPTTTAVEGLMMMMMGVWVVRGEISTSDHETQYRVAQGELTHGPWSIWSDLLSSFSPPFALTMFCGYNCANRHRPNSVSKFDTQSLGYFRAASLIFSFCFSLFNLLDRQNMF